MGWMGRNGVKSVTAIRTPLLARVRALRHGFNTTPRHAYTASEFTLVTRIYSNSWWISDSSSDLGHSSEYRDAQYFNPRPRHSFTITGKRPESRTRYFKLGCTPVTSTSFLNGDRVREKAHNDSSIPSSVKARSDGVTLKVSSEFLIV
ncbi:hypothetical protein PIB30_017656 [Stylosanthes scabra]|uniref:Uncharacterized protein n=1 Tax=Stylosanthes scabra TaxID=79078 RepID=A0ABU6X992_9FABA|nr:hypothetical protein [Stylosanthes scabra]